MCATPVAEAGYLSLELASGFRLLPVDICQPALDVLIAAKEKRGVENIRVVREDFFSMQGHQPYDAIVFVILEALKKYSFHPSGCVEERQSSSRRIMITTALPSQRYPDGGIRSNLRWQS